jgi:pyridoxal phosphate enzyme (YggS family)
MKTYTQQQAGQNLEEVVLNIEDARCNFDDHHIVQTVAISKYNNTKEVAILFEEGQRAFGENKIQELKHKQKELEELPILWHFVGHLQSNKINALIECNPFLFQSLHSWELALKLDKKLKEQNKKMNVLLQVNISNSTTQSGVSKKNVLKVVDDINTICTNLNLKGLMCIGANSDELKIVNECFKQMAILHKQCLSKYKNMGILSCGMSGDYMQAILNGANMIRLGSILFKTQ